MPPPPCHPPDDASDWPQTERLVEVILHGAPAQAGGQDMEQERAVAVQDLLRENRFSVPQHAPGPYRLTLALDEQQRLLLDIADAEGKHLLLLGLSLSPLRRLLAEYARIFERYHDALRHAPLHQLEPLDMARRATHDEAAEILRRRLGERVRVDHATARRLFTLIATLHRRRRVP